MTDTSFHLIALATDNPVALSAAAIGSPTIFTSGQVGVDPATGQLLEGFEAQVEQAITNLEAVLASGGSDLSHVLKTTCYLTDTAQFAAFDAIYGRRFPAPHPARTTLATRLVSTILFEIEAIAVPA